MTKAQDKKYNTRLAELIDLHKRKTITQDEYDARHKALVQEVYGDKTN